jgi:hypothetical protein
METPGRPPKRPVAPESATAVMVAGVVLAAIVLAAIMLAAIVLAIWFAPQREPEPRTGADQHSAGSGVVGSILADAIAGELKPRHR